MISDVGGKDLSQAQTITLPINSVSPPLMSTYVVCTIRCCRVYHYFLSSFLPTLLCALAKRTSWRFDVPDVERKIRLFQALRLDVFAFLGRRDVRRAGKRGPFVEPIIIRTAKVPFYHLTWSRNRQFLLRLKEKKRSVNALEIIAHPF